MDPVNTPPSPTGHLHAIESVAHGIPANSIHALGSARELFWQNVMREILTSLSILSAQQPHHPSVAVALKESAGTTEERPPDHRDLFDGRLGIITVSGSRIPIGAVHPLFACSVPGTADSTALSVALECTVFQITTPAGEVFTLPLHEMRSFHALSEELMDEIKTAARSEGPEGEESEPFGFAAYTSLAKTKFAPEPGASSKREPEA
jgi:hypothetical protein